MKLFNIDIDGQDLTPHFDKFSLFYCALVVCVIVFPLTILKEMQCITKFNSAGIYFVSALLIFVIYQGIATLATDNFHFEYKENNFEDSWDIFFHLSFDFFDNFDIVAH